jgi:Flp pilus assembly protein TadD
VIALSWSPLAWASQESQRLYTAGIIPFQAQRYEEALELFRQAVEADPQDYLAVYYLGVTQGKLGRPAESVPYLEKVLELRPEFFPARQDLAVAYYHLQRYRDALRHLVEAQRARPQNGLIHYYKGLCYYRLAERTAAVTSLTRAAELEQFIRPKAHYYLGLTYLEEEKLAEALQAFQTAASESPDTNVAFSAVDFIREINEQLQRQRAEKPWELRLAVGSQFDSNVVLLPDRGPALGQITDEEDFRFTFSVGGRLDLWRTPSTYLMGDYNLYQTVHTDLDDFDLQAHLFRLIGGWSLSPSLNVGLEGGTNFFRVGDDDYLHEIYGMPFMGFFLRRWAYTYLSYRLTNENYLASFLDPARDGLGQTVAVRQYFLLEGFDRYFFLGYQYSIDNPSLHLGNDFQYKGNQAEVGMLTPAPFDTLVETTYFFRNEDYSFANSRTAFTRSRDDDVHDILVILRKKLTSFLEINVSYLGRINNSNIGDFKYKRHIASLGFQVVF